MAVAKMEQYANNSDCTKLEIDEVDGYSDVDVKADKFLMFSVWKKKGEHLVASKWRWDDCQR